MPEMYEVYDAYSANYDELVNHEDCDKNLKNALLSICDWENKSIFEAGIGTGRVTAIYANLVKRIIAADRSIHMITAAKENLDQYLDKIEFVVKDNLSLKEIAIKADIFIEGWAFGHSVCDIPDSVEKIADVLVKQAFSLVKPEGKIIFIETLGTGNEEPKAPVAPLEKFYNLLENKYGFVQKVIRTDYLFETVNEASRILGFFFGEKMGKLVGEKGSNRVPECTGIWIK
jgi:ubiquinone/menaquinone biosynthesis C-methylase UbiE